MPDLDWRGTATEPILCLKAPGSAWPKFGPLLIGGARHSIFSGAHKPNLRPRLESTFRPVRGSVRNLSRTTSGGSWRFTSGCLRPRGEDGCADLAFGEPIELAGFGPFLVRSDHSLKPGRTTYAAATIRPRLGSAYLVDRRWRFTFDKHTRADIQKTREGQLPKRMFESEPPIHNLVAPRKWS